MDTLTSAAIILDHEKLYEEAARLENVTTLELDGITIISGDHPERGRVHIIVPLLGKGAVLSALPTVSSAILPSASASIPRSVVLD